VKKAWVDSTGPGEGPARDVPMGELGRDGTGGRRLGSSGTGEALFARCLPFLTCFRRRASLSELGLGAGLVARCFDCFPRVRGGASLSEMGSSAVVQLVIVGTRRCTAHLDFCVPLPFAGPAHRDRHRHRRRPVPAPREWEDVSQSSPSVIFSPWRSCICVY
jgi:hypothetical protein